MTAATDWAVPGAKVAEYGWTLALDPDETVSLSMRNAKP